MKERLIHLRVKIKSLAAEARIIRAEANKTKGPIKAGLNEHRKTVVRFHARHNLLAYGLLRGIPYKRIERRCHQKPDFSKVKTLAKRFGGTEEAIKAWIKEAKE